MLVVLLSSRRDNGRMTLDEIRVTNLAKLVVEFGTIAALAEAAKTSDKYLSSLLNKTKLDSGKPRSLGRAVARKLEIAATKPPGWMDHDHENGGIVVTHTDMSPDESELLRLYRASGTAKRKVLLSLARLKVTED